MFLLEDSFRGVERPQFSARLRKGPREENRIFEGKWIANRQRDGSNTSKGINAKFLDCEFNVNRRFTSVQLGRSNITSRRLSTKLVRSARRRRTHCRINFMGMMNDLEATDTPHKNDDFPPAHRIDPCFTLQEPSMRTFPCKVTSNHEFSSECFVLNVLTKTPGCQKGQPQSSHTKKIVPTRTARALGQIPRSSSPQKCMTKSVSPNWRHVRNPRTEKGTDFFAILTPLRESP